MGNNNSKNNSSSSNDNNNNNNNNDTRKKENINKNNGNDDDKSNSSALTKDDPTPDPRRVGSCRALAAAGGDRIPHQLFIQSRLLRSHNKKFLTESSKALPRQLVSSFLTPIQNLVMKLGMPS